MLRVILAFVLLGVSAPALAQQTDKRACEQASATVGAGNELSVKNPSGKADDQPLSEKLARSDGVICPPNVDPDIKAPTPQGGRMPVIPPPGSPGGDPNVRPK